MHREMYENVNFDFFFENLLIEIRAVVWGSDLSKQEDGRILKTGNILGAITPKNSF